MGRTPPLNPPPRPPAEARDITWRNLPGCVLMLAFSLTVWGLSIWGVVVLVRG